MQKRKIVMDRDELLALARTVAQKAHCPYSHFHVGAALVAGGNVYTGVNIEISSYGLTLCAERAALAAAISDGAGPVTQVAVACIDAPPEAPLNERTPCGACRQWLADLAPHAVIYIDGSDRDFLIADLLPHAFGL
ncbi:MAG: cytidine deaminase [Ktedonobacteraceae bacterium]